MQPFFPPTNDIDKDFAHVEDLVENAFSLLFTFSDTCLPPDRKVDLL
jgi:hypothetical protein